MTIYALLLPGWDNTSTWGEDYGELYAQVNRNGYNDADGPEYWITPPHYPVAHTTQQLAELIGQVTGTDTVSVLRAMSTGARIAGASDDDCKRLGLSEFAASDEPSRPDDLVQTADPPPVAVGSLSDDELARRIASAEWHGGPDDLARNAPGIGVTHEATRRRQAEGAGADRSWRVGADGEATVAEMLEPLTTPSRLDRLLRRRPAWAVLHSVPVGTGRGDIDHVVIGPPGVVTINTKHHRAAKVRVNGDQLTVNGHVTDYVPKARRETDRATALLGGALTAAGRHDIASRLHVRSVIATVGARVVVEAFAPGVTVLMTRELVHHLTALPVVFTPAEVEAAYECARYRAVWTRPTI